MNRDEEVPRPFTHDAKAVYEDKTKEIIPQIEDSERFAEIYAVMREIFESDLPNTRNYDHHKSCFETVKQYEDGTYNLFPNSHFRKKTKPKAEEAGDGTLREEMTEAEPATEIVDIDLSQSGYDIQLGSWIYIGTGEVMLQSVTDKGVELYDGTMFPLEMPYEVFLERLRENPLNDHLKKSVDLEPKTAYKDAFYVYPEKDIATLTRNQLYLTVPWVRIPPSPPQSPVNSRVCWTFLFLHTPDETIFFVLELADFLLEQHYLNPNPGSYLVLCPRLDRSYLPIGFRSHPNPEETFLFPSLVQRKFWICSRDGRKYWRLC